MQLSEKEEFSSARARLSPGRRSGEANASDRSGSDNSASNSNAHAHSDSNDALVARGPNWAPTGQKGKTMAKP